MSATREEVWLAMAAAAAANPACAPEDVPARADDLVREWARRYARTPTVPTDHPTQPATPETLRRGR